MSGWGNQGQQGWGNQGQQGQQGWGNQGQQGQQGWGNQCHHGQKSWGHQGQQGQQGWGNQGQQGQQGQQWGNQGQQGQQWGNQGQQGQQGWGQQGQQWGNQGGFQPIEGHYYKLQSGLGNNLVLDVSQNPNFQMNKLIVWTDNNGANQKFTFKNVGNGRWGIFCAKNGLTVEVPNGNKGTRVICSQPNKQQNQFWSLVPCTKDKFKGHNAFFLRSFSNLVLDVQGNKAEKGTGVCVWQHNDGDNQIWIAQQTS